MTDPRYRATLDRLYRLRRFGMRPGLEVIRALLDALDHPERSFRAIHVTGSKGKGSVSAIAASLLGATGRRVGLFTSPHLVSFRERFRVGARTIPRSAVVEGTARIEAIGEALLSEGRIDRPPTFFEISTALAFDWFRASRVTEAVVEVGIGGRLDATNVLDAPVGVISTIELEHTDVLGPTLGAIAREKAGIFHRGMRAVLGELPDEADAEVERALDLAGVRAWHLGREVRVSDRTISPEGQRATFRTPHGSFEGLTLPLHGIFQAGNAALAIAAVELLAEAEGFPLPPKAIARGLAQVVWRGRLERIAERPPSFLDVAHTPESARAVAESLGEILPFSDPSESVVLFGCLAGKDAERILDQLAPLARTIVVAPVRSARALDPAALRRAAVGRFARIVQAPDVATGYGLARAAVGPDGLFLAIGSDYLAGELLGRLEGRPDEEPDLSDPGLGEPSSKAFAGVPATGRTPDPA
ncbi:MAG TPA: folylpolyglutamate synthase/dihydrofolate synthase family protein [Thermoplasmata archaeon]|nr:folylpolyglutamate synthase/dihydrofolate synthase family protein [Thermoplasmata archaeon]